MKKLTKLEAPDGGWGILVCVGMALPVIFGLGVIPSFGLIFGDFLKGTGAETSAITLVTSAYYSALSCSGLLANALYKRYSLRSVGLLGGILYFMGSVLQIFVETTVELFVAFSLIQGVGVGLMIQISFTSFNNYFVKKRAMMMGFGQALIGVGTMFYPVVVQKLHAMYGFRGCLLVLAAINSHTILGMVVMQPVEWHMRKVKVEEEEEVKEFLKNPLPESTSSLNSLGLRLNKKLSSRAASLANSDKFTGAIVVNDASVEFQEQPKKASCWEAVVGLLDLSLLKDPIYLNIILGMSFALYSDRAFFTLQPLYLFELNYTEAEAASIVAIGAAAELGSRVFLMLSAFFITDSTRYVYLIGAILTIVARLVFLKVFEFTAMAIMTTILGFLRTSIKVPMPLVIAEFLPQERFASGFGLFMFLQGNITFLIGPIVGYLRDKTQDYPLTFHCLNFFLALCAVPWLIEIFYLRLQRKSISAEQEGDEKNS